MAGDGASIGEVYVDILPKSDNFFARFQAQTRAQASRAGDELGGVIGKSITDHIAKGIRDGLSNNARADAARSGEQSGTAYAAAFKQRVESALRGLTDVKVGLDSSQVNRDITQLRTQLERLRGRDLTVSVDVTQAYVDVVTLREELDKLGRTRPSVRADVDTARAMAQVQALIAEVEALGRLNPTVRPDVDDSGVRQVGSSARDSAGSVSTLVAAGVALGPALVPGAAAGAAAIAGLIPVAVGAAGALGVVLLGISGVVGAVKAMSAADDQATQSTVSLAGNQARLASASDAVRSAQAAVANTVASAADSQRRASQAIVTAELSEADAHRTLAQAQQAVTAARIDAARAAEDLQSRVANNALDQRQAAIDTAKAEEALAAARQSAAQAGTPANNRAVQEAEIALERQRQRTADLATEHQRLADDKAKSDKQGIDGSTQVVSALDRVRQATEAVHKAEQATADARAAYAAQARQSAFSIAQAQQGVISAQRALQQATEQTATAGGAAMLRLQQSMDDLSPAGRRFAAFIYGLRTPLLDLRRVGETGLLPGAQQSIETFMTQMPRATDYTRRFSTEVGTLAVAGANAFTQPYWLNFTDLLVDRAIPAMETGARISYNFALGLAGLVRAALPLGEDFGGGLLRFSERFAFWANQLERSHGFQDLMDYVRTQGPIVAHTIGEVVTAAVRLVEATAPIGGVTLTTIRLLAQAINAIPVPVLTALVGGIIAVTAASKAMSFTNAVKETGAFTGASLLLEQTIGSARKAMVDAGPDVGVFGRTVAGIKGGAEGAAGGIGGLAGMIGPGGLLAGGIGVAVVGLGLLATKMAEQKAKTDAAVASYERFGDAVAKARAAGEPDNAAELIKNDKALQDLILHAAEYGVSGKTVVDALSGQRSAFDSVNTALAAHRAELVKTIQEHTTQGGKGQRVMDDTAVAASNEVQHLDELAGRFGKVAQDQARAKDAADLYTQSQDKVTEGAYRQTPAQAALGEALKKLADSTATAADKATALRTADEAVFGGMRAAITTADASAAAQDRLTQTLKAYTDEHGRNTAAFSANTAAGRDNRAALEERLTALNNEFFADVQSGVAIEDATRKHDTNRDAILNAAKAATTDKDEVDKLGLAFGTLPTDPKVAITVSGVQQVMDSMNAVQIANFALMHGLSPEEATRQWEVSHSRAEAAFRTGSGRIARAQGGPIYGPGGPTDDLVPAIGPGGARYRLSNDEHIITAAEVKAAGGHGAIMEWRRWLLGGGSPQVPYPGDGSGGIAFATGGPVTWPVNVDISKTKIPQPMAFLGGAAGSVVGALQWLHAQAGKPYIWASAGPDGYDCSGLISATYRLLHGLTPYVHQFSTMNEAPYFPLPGYGPVLTVGWTNPGERGPGGDGVGHTAGVLAGLPFESRGGDGVVVGRGVTPVTSFAHVGHYDSGGPLPPGLTYAYNGTGKTEWVFTDDQMRAAGSGGDGRMFRDLNVHGSDGMSVDELVHKVIGEIAWQMK